MHDELGFVAIPPCLWGEPEVHLKLAHSNNWVNMIFGKVMGTLFTFTNNTLNQLSKYDF